MSKQFSKNHPNGKRKPRKIPTVLKEPAEDIRRAAVTQSKLATLKQEPAKHSAQSPDVSTENQQVLADSLRRAYLAPGWINSEDVLTLQRSIGNQAISSMFTQPVADPKVQFNPTVDTITYPGAQVAHPVANTVVQRDNPGDYFGVEKVELGAEKPISLKKLKGLDRKMASIHNEYGKYIAEKATEMGIDVATAAAVLKVESGGHGFDLGTGQMIIRFENHVFHKLWGKDNPDEFAKHFKFSSKKKWEGHFFRADENGEWETFHGDQSKEWTVLEFARAFDDEAALRSISMGAAQIMGGNYKKAGYKSAREMFDQMSGGTAADASMALSCPVVDPEQRLLATKAQLDGLFAFIKSTKICMDGLKEKDNVKFATGYNGTGQAALYGQRISDAAAAYTTVTQSAK